MKKIIKLSFLAMVMVVCISFGAVMGVTASGSIYDFELMSTIHDGHSLLIAGSYHDRIAIVDYNGYTLWELKGFGTLWTEVNDAEIDENGDIVYASTSTSSHVRKIRPNLETGEYTLLWEYDVPEGGENHTSQILANGDVLICEAYTEGIRIIELDGETGEISKLIGDEGMPEEGFGEGSAHSQVRQITKTSEGTYLVPQFLGTLTYEYDQDGKTVATYPSGGAFTAIKDLSGNVIVSGGYQTTVKAFSPDGEEIWSIGKNDISGITLDFPAGVVALDNGNILLANWGHYDDTASEACVVEINPLTKELVWRMNSGDGSEVSTIYLIKDLDKDFVLSEIISSPVDVVANAVTDKVYAADYTSKTITVIDSNRVAPVATYVLPDCPNALAINEDGTVLYVACGELNGKVLIIDTSTGAIAKIIELGHTPTALAFGESEDVLYVANRYDNTISRIELTADGLGGQVTNTAKTTKEPMGIAYSSEKLFVAGHLPAMAATESVVSSAICVLDPDTLQTLKVMPLYNGSTDLKDMAVSPDGEHIYVTHTIGRYWVATTQLDRGWIYTNAITEIDTQSGEINATMLLDDIDRGAGNPWGVDVSNDKLFVSIAGTGELIIIDREEMRSRIDGIMAGEYVSADESVSEIADLPNSLTFLTDIKERIELDASGTKGIAYLDGKLYAANYYSGTISVVNTTNNKKFRDIALSIDVEETDERAGERLWNDATLSFGKWQSCASCHPDARTDGLNWDNMNDGIGVYKQARTMLDTFRRGRVMATGIRQDADVAVKAGMKYIMFNAGATAQQYSQINKYIQSLTPLASPMLNKNGTLTESAKRGKELFEGKANCASCHSGEIYGQDVFVYDLYKTQPEKEQRGLLIPPLREVWRTSPYLHDGSAQTIQDVFAQKIKSGNTNLAQLTQAELDDLECYVLSIGTYTEEQEPEEPEDPYIEVTKTTKEVDGVTVYDFLCKPYNLDIGIKIIFSAYKGDEIVALYSQDYTGSDIPFSFDTEYDEVRVFVWESFGSIKPILNFEIVE